ncbi:MAG TPA: hypothetical protein VN238_18370 [Solirubrobacteraceae bacterium]|nr:hypothetical protein [Solirubrobacteraceae bacterium]
MTTDAVLPEDAGPQVPTDPTTEPLRAHVGAGELIASALPHWWAHEDPKSELHAFIVMCALFLDELATAAEQIHADQSMQTAGLDALRSEWAVLFGADQEQQLTADALRAYLNARAADDGTIASLEEALYAIAEHTPDQERPVPRSVLEFPDDGSGLQLPITSPAAAINVVDNVNDHRIEVTVAQGVVFDAGVLERAVERHRPAHYLPGVVETSS